MKKVIHSDQAPAAIGPYSQALKVGQVVYLSGQIPLRADMTLVESSLQAEASQVFENLRAVCEAAGGGLRNIVKLNIFLTNMQDFAEVNEVMKQFFSDPYPARACIGVKELPKGVRIEADGIMVL